MPLGFDIDENLCTECLRCLAACTLAKLGRVQPPLARIAVLRRWPEVPEIRVCRFEDCPGQPCIESCPVEVITKDARGFVLIGRDACTGCEACVEACPYGAIRMEEGDSTVACKCDFCGGAPACVPECVTGALLRKGDS